MLNFFLNHQLVQHKVIYNEVYFETATEVRSALPH